MRCQADWEKGILVTPTVHGNLCLDRLLSILKDKEGCNTTQAGLEEVLRKAELNVKNLPLRQVITFAGLRAHEDSGDFIIGEVEDAEGFIDCAGIESPGLPVVRRLGKWWRDFKEKMGLGGEV